MSHLEYGIVHITGGQHKGRIGYYDNDDCDENGNDVAIVYFGQPFNSPYYMILPEYLEAASVAHLPFEDWVKKNPALARSMGVER